MTKQLICSNAENCKSSDGCPHAVPHKGKFGDNCGPSMPCYEDESGVISKCIEVGTTFKKNEHPNDTIRRQQELINELTEKLQEVVNKLDMAEPECLGRTRMHNTDFSNIRDNLIEEIEGLITKAKGGE